MAGEEGDEVMDDGVERMKRAVERKESNRCRERNERRQE